MLEQVFFSFPLYITSTEMSPTGSFLSDISEKITKSVLYIKMRNPRSPFRGTLNDEIHILYSAEYHGPTYQHNLGISVNKDLKPGLPLNILYSLLSLKYLSSIMWTESDLRFILGKLTEKIFLLIGLSFEWKNHLFIRITFEDEKHLSKIKRRF